MRIIIDSQNNGEKGENQKIDLSYVINNNCTISILDVSYYVGYYNITQQLGNNIVKYNNGTKTKTLILKDGLYTLSSYFTEIKTMIKQNNDNPTNINYSYNDMNGTITISVTAPYKLSIIKTMIKLLGFHFPQSISSNTTSDKPVNFTPHKMFYIHLKQINNKYNYFNGKQDDILAKIPVTNDIFGTLVHYTFNVPQTTNLSNAISNSLEIYITDENGETIDFHGMPVFYTLEIL